ncbi:MAG: cysteine desulfurase family protein [Flavobacteriales bacterium]
MKKIYLDNAASTPLHKEVINTMTDVIQKYYGNPSSTHSFGRETKSIIENARKTIGKELKCQSNEIIFTSGGTEANNLILRSAVQDMGVKRIITQPVEHKSVLETVLDLSKKHHIILEMLPIDSKGNFNLNDLEQKLKSGTAKTLVSLIHGNNETGNLVNLEKITTLCHENNALFHSDTVQTIGHYVFDLNTLPIDFISCSAHKMHGPKGVGFAFARKSLGLHSTITGGKQERNKRSGTENVYGIAGLAKAFEMAYENLEENRRKITNLKKYAIEQFKQQFEDCIFIGESGNIETGLYTILNVGLKNQSKLLTFELDLKGIAISQGSACESGSTKKSHVIQSIHTLEEQNTYANLRISFSIYNTKEDIDLLIKSLKN